MGGCVYRIRLVTRYEKHAGPSSAERGLCVSLGRCVQLLPSDSVFVVLLGACGRERSTTSCCFKVCFHKFENSCTGFLLVSVSLSCHLSSFD